MTTGAVAALLRLETAGLVRSWLLRAWIVISLLLGLIAVANADQGRGLAHAMVNWLSVYMLPTAIFIGVLGTGALGADLDVAADSILSRAVTRIDYVVGKTGARLVAVLLGHLAVALPTLLFMEKFGRGHVDTYQIMAAAFAVGLILLFITSLGAAIAGFVRNGLVAVAALMVLLASQSVIFDFLGLAYLSPGAVVRDVESWLNGTASVWDEARVFLTFGAATLVCAGAAAVIFDRRDL